MKEYEVIKDIECFDLKRTLECGQCFRWKYDENDGWFVGIIKDRVVKLKQEGKDLYVKSNDMNKIIDTISAYLDLKTDYKKIEKDIAKHDSYIESVLPKTTGIRILKQDMFEMLISYIISANNNIPRISRSINMLSEKYGRKVDFENTTYYLFPNAYQMQGITEDDLLKCSVGFRARYIRRAIAGILDKSIDLNKIKMMNTSEAKKELLKILGVGPKVADCILLFGASKYDVFPVDVWIKRVVEDIYFKREVRLKEIEEFAKDRFGGMAGIAQQHLFHSVRNLK